MTLFLRLLHHAIVLFSIFLSPTHGEFVSNSELSATTARGLASSSGTGTDCQLEWFRSGREVNATSCPGFLPYGGAESAETCCTAAILPALQSLPTKCDVRYLFKVHDRHLARANAVHQCCVVAIVNGRSGRNKIKAVQWGLVAAKYGCTSQHSWFDWSAHSPCLAAWWDGGRGGGGGGEVEGGAAGACPVEARLPYPDQKFWGSSVRTDAQRSAVLALQTDGGVPYREVLHRCCGRISVPDECDVRFRLNYHDKIFRKENGNNDHFCCLSDSLFVARAYGCMHYGSSLILQWEPDAQSLNVAVSDLFSMLQVPVLTQLWTTSATLRVEGAGGGDDGDKKSTLVVPAADEDEHGSSGGTTGAEKAKTIAQMLVRCLPIPYELHPCDHRCAYSSWGLTDVWGYVKVDYLAEGSLFFRTRKVEKWWYLTELKTRVPSDETCVEVVRRVEALCAGGLGDNVNGKIANQCDATLAQNLHYTPVGRLALLS
eukprot:g18038.t1